MITASAKLCATNFLTMSRYWSDVAKGLTPYVPGEQPKVANLVKLNTNENPYPPSPRVLQAIAAELGETGNNLRRYPDPNSEAVKAAIARQHCIEPSQIFNGNGSDEVLAHIFLGLLKHSLPILFPDITYSFYPVYCGLYQVPFRTVPLRDGFELRVDDYLVPNGGVIFPNPNAPTGRAIALTEIERLLQANRESVVVIDEAYVDFGGETAIPLIAKYPNLLVVQTLSKARSLAGLRVGFAAGHVDLIEALTRVKDSFNSYPLDRLAIAGAVAAYEDVAYFEQTRHAVMATRERLTATLTSLGFEVIPSSANFVFVRHPNRDARELVLALRRQNILVRHFSLPRIEQYLRITIGTDAECDALVAALGNIEN